MIVKRTALVKCRVTPATKFDLRAAARRAKKTDSDLLRGLIGQVIDGRAMDEGVRADMATVRSVANSLLDKASTYDLDPAAVQDLAARLRGVAERHLGRTP